MLSLPLSLSISSLRARHLAAISVGVAASVLLPKPGWGVLALLLVPLAMHSQAWLLVAFSMGLASTAISGAIEIKLVGRDDIELTSARGPWAPYWLKLP